MASFTFRRLEEQKEPSRVLQWEHPSQGTTSEFWIWSSKTSHQRIVERPLALIMNVQPLALPGSCDFICSSSRSDLMSSHVFSRFPHMRRISISCILESPFVIFHHEHHVHHVRLQKTTAHTHSAVTHVLREFQSAPLLCLPSSSFSNLMVSPFPLHAVHLITKAALLVDSAAAWNEGDTTLRLLLLAIGCWYKLLFPVCLGG